MQSGWNPVDAFKLVGIVGHDLLAKRLDSFAGNWDKRRKEMIESVEASYRRADITSRDAMLEVTELIRKNRERLNRARRGVLGE